MDTGHAPPYEHLQAVQFTAWGGSGPYYCNPGLTKLSPKSRQLTTLAIAEPRTSRDLRARGSRPSAGKPCRVLPLLAEPTPAGLMVTSDSLNRAAQGSRCFCGAEWIEKPPDGYACARRHVVHRGDLEQAWSQDSPNGRPKGDHPQVEGNGKVRSRKCFLAVIGLRSRQKENWSSARLARSRPCGRGGRLDCPPVLGEGHHHRGRRENQTGR
jgi:hypothetical protein